jgi:hypothetical protein
MMVINVVNNQILIRVSSYYPIAAAAGGDYKQFQRWAEF